MRMWIDTEFNDFKGALISMAIVAEDGSEWYEVTHCDDPTLWVLENVMPKLRKQPINLDMMRQSLVDFLSSYEAMYLIADWPEDIAHFCNLLIAGPGLRINTPKLTMEVRRDLDSESALPHNALSDARAIKQKHLQILAKGK